MSGDVQPRKRKDKKKKKDDLGIEEPRGTAAALGEGDVFMHSHHEHSTGGHWCAKVIFFSLLAVLVGLIGLIILENRGLSELEANSVESRYSGVLEGWLEEGHDDDHHDAHTLELNHHDDEDDDDDHSGGLDHDDDHDESHEDEHDDENDEDMEQSHEADEEEDDERNQDEDDDERNQDEDDDDDRNQDDDDDDESREENDENDDEQDEADQEEADSQQADENDNDSEEQNLDTAENEDEVEERSYRRYYRSNENQVNNDDDDDDQSVERDDDQQDEADNDSQENDDDQEDDTKNDSQENDDDEQNQLYMNEENDNENSDENEDDEDHENHNDHHEDDSNVELEHIEDEVFDENVSTETSSRKPRESEEDSKETAPVADADDDEVELLESNEFDELDELPDELPIPVPKGKPLVEVEDTTSTEKPQDTLADEEEYERQQEALRKEKEQASQGMWLKLVVGGALLVATQAVLRRATAPRENEDEVNTTREETPLSDRRMTLIAEPVPPPVTPKSQGVSRPVVQKEVVRQAPVVKSAPPPPEEDDEEEEEEIIVSKDMKHLAAEKDTVNKELYSDEEEEVEEEEEDIIEDIVEEKKEPPKPIAPTKEPPNAPVKEKNEPSKVVEKEPTPEEDDDVEIIEEEDIGEDFEEEEEISDVDDAELLNRLEAKYGRLPEPERPGRKKDSGNSIEDEWPGEPSDAYWRDELDHAERDLRQGEWTAAVERASAAKLRTSARARYIIARALDSAAEAKRDNGLLTKAIAAYLELLKMNEKLSVKKLIEVTDRALDRMKFRGNYLGTEPLYRLLIRRFPDDPIHRNNLTVSFLMANRVDLAEDVIKETLRRWPNDRLALAHHGFILKTLHNKLEEAVDAFTKALEGDNGPANESRFYYHLGDSLLLLGRFKEAHEVHKRGAKLGHFLSPAQRSLYNVERLKSQPWWNIEKTPYARLARALEKSWKEILKEGRAAQALYEKEKEGLKERGEWSQLDLFVRGREVPNRCARAPVTCSVVRSEVAASGCRRGQVKFSSMEAGTHVRPHVGPTNCRLRMHLGLTNTKDTFIRVDQEIRQWQIGKVLMFDDSFEHEVWHNGTGSRLVLIVDVWHPDLTRTERAQLPAI